jgi:hypothetical protein
VAGLAARWPWHGSSPPAGGHVLIASVEAVVFLVVGSLPSPSAAPARADFTAAA